VLIVRSLVKNYGSIAAVRDISFEVKSGDIFTLLGPSGCGKTTTLQCIAGLETPTAGRIMMADGIVFDGDERVLVPANRRRLGMVFQSYAIWPHMSVFENVAFPLVHGARRNETINVRERVLRALALVKMEAFIDRPAPHLSGGQQQRIALARALVHEPSLLLLDEPLSNLDAKLRDVMRVELRQLIKDLGITTIFVTHDQVEALSMSDRIVLMRDGRIVQSGTPQEIYLRPVSAFTSDFMGRSNLIPGRLADRASGAVETSFGTVRCVVPESVGVKGDICIAIRPQAIAVVPGLAAAGGVNCFPASVIDTTFLGDVIEATIAIAGYRLRATFSPYEGIAIGDEVSVDFGEGRCVAVDADIMPASGAGALT
jgi:iron(III) transport system ATP-binding protein